MLLVSHPKNPLPRPVSRRFLPMFSTKSLKFWGFTFKSLTHVIFCVWYKIRSNFILFMCISCFPTYHLKGYIKVIRIIWAKTLGYEKCLLLNYIFDYLAILNTQYFLYFQSHAIEYSILIQRANLCPQYLCFSFKCILSPF